ncbi:response regulator [Curtobacterium sp. L1-20]|uniref:response regulator n=1 Tax=Curtobacterium sp. L1-20 TaxID=3138181 RepID=UPI003B51AC8D
MIRVALVDDQELFRAGLRFMLDKQADIEVVGEAADGEAGVDLIRETVPDVALLDVRMPRLDGVEVVRRLLGDDGPGIATKIIVLTTFAVDDATAEAIRLGAAGFLLKDATPDALLTAIRTVAAGNAVVSPDDLAALLRLESGTTHAPPAPAAFRSLAPRERIVFDHVAAGRTNVEIARIEFVSESTIKTQVSSVLTKLGLRDRVQLVIYAHQYRLTGDRTAGGDSPSTLAP